MRFDSGYRFRRYDVQKVVAKSGLKEAESSLGANSKQPPRIAVQHGFTFAFGAVHRLNFCCRVPVAQIEWIIGPDHDMVRANDALQVFDGFDPIDEIVEVEIL